MKIFELLKICDTLKHLKRTGWVKNNIDEPETVASHMYRMAVLAMALDGQIPGIDASRCVRMALVHDIGEAIVGDITPHCGISEENKHALEAKAMQQIATFVPEDVGTDWVTLWREYEQQSTEEAKVVYHLDKFDMIAQAFDYEQKYGIDLHEFFTSTVGKLKMEPFVSWDTELRAKRAEWIQQKK
ncbi:unnamed protein product, partial [Mesorhabditis belari]|uniref:5'-deoxynucleotidase HDDC2 n=1 Tax=Mesorhabditis belari TaxID=2138241 RepID=A0AAF3FM66_9BILA